MFLSHAIADALLGAVAAGDIGQHFPNTDQSIRGMSSIDILRQVTALLARTRHARSMLTRQFLPRHPKLRRTFRRCEK